MEVFSEFIQIEVWKSQEGLCHQGTERMPYFGTTYLLLSYSTHTALMMYQDTPLTPL